MKENKGRNKDILTGLVLIWSAMKFVKLEMHGWKLEVSERERVKEK